jgi:hypothetical protein
MDSSVVLTDVGAPASSAFSSSSFSNIIVTI